MRRQFKLSIPSSLTTLFSPSWIKDDAKEYLDNEKLRALISRHSEYGASPIYLWEEKSVEEPIEAAPAADVDGEEKDEVKVEDETPVETRTVIKGEWERVNNRAPLWMREPKDVSEVEYKEFFKATFKDVVDPLAWSHFKVCLPSAPATRFELIRGPAD